MLDVESLGEILIVKHADEFQRLFPVTVSAGVGRIQRVAGHVAFLADVYVLFHVLVPQLRCQCLTAVLTGVVCARAMYRPAQQS